MASKRSDPGKSHPDDPRKKKKPTPPPPPADDDDVLEPSEDEIVEGPSSASSGAPIAEVVEGGDEFVAEAELGSNPEMEAEVAEIDEEASQELVALASNEPPPADVSAVDLGKEAGKSSGGSGSGGSVLEWASLVEEIDPAAASVSGVRLDAPDKEQPAQGSDAAKKRSLEGSGSAPPLPPEPAEEDVLAAEVAESSGTDLNDVVLGDEASGAIVAEASSAVNAGSMDPDIVSLGDEPSLAGPPSGSQGASEVDLAGDLEPGSVASAPPSEISDSSLAIIEMAAEADDEERLPAAEPSGAHSAPLVEEDEVVDLSSPEIPVISLEAPSAAPVSDIHPGRKAGDSSDSGLPDVVVHSRGIEDESADDEVDLSDPELSVQPPIEAAPPSQATSGLRPDAEIVHDRESEVQFDSDSQLVMGEAGAPEGGVILGGGTGKDEHPSGRDLIAEAVESGADMAAPIPEIDEPTSPSSGLRREDAITEPGADDVIEAPEEDIVAESESGVLAEAEPEVIGESASGVLIEAEAEVEDEIVGSVGTGDSSVNLGEPEEEVSIGSPSSGPVVSEPASGPTSSEVNFDAVADEPTSGAAFEGAVAGEIAEEEGVIGEAADEEVIGEAAGESGVIGEEAAEEEEEPGVPAKKEPMPRPRSRLIPLLIGTTVGAATCVGLWVGGIEPPNSWRLAGGDTGKQVATGPKDQQRPGPVSPGPQQGTPHERVRDAVVAGDFSRIKPEDLGQLKDDKPEEVALRGQYRWQSYLQKQAMAKAPLKADDESVKQAMEDLKKADTPEAVLLLGQLQQLTNNPTDAQKTLEAGAAKHPNDPRFEAALLRFRLQQGDKPAGMSRMSPEDAAMLALLLVAFQPPGGGDPMQAAGAEPPEAGLDFYKAIEAMRAQKFSDAIVALKKAQKLHEERRFTRLGRAQNPGTDPNEEIFLYACRELQLSWEMLEKLRAGNYLAADKKDPLKAIDDLIKDAGSLKTLADLGTKLAEAKVIDKPEDVAPGVDKLLADRKDAEKKIEDLNKKLVDSKKESDDLQKLLTDSKKLAEDLGDKLKASETKVADLTRELKTANDQIDLAVKDLIASKALPATATRADLMRGIKDVVMTANVKDPAGTLRALQVEVTDLKQAREKEVAGLKDMHQKEVTRLNDAHKKQVDQLNDRHTGEVTQLSNQLAQRWKPAELLNAWRAALEEREQKELAKQAEADARRVLANPMATPEHKAQAEVIEGLALRNQSKYAEAKAALEKGKAALPKDSPWQATANAALKEVSDPAAYVGLTIEDLQNRGKPEEALALLTRSMEALPKEAQPALLAQRALLGLADARTRARGGRIPINDPGVARARKDAEEAEMAGVAEGFYVSGRIAEETNQYETAIAKYRKALEMHKALDAVGARYRVALARALNRANIPWTPPPPAKQPDAPPDKVGRADREAVDPVLLLLAVTLLQPLPMQPSNQAEAQRLADEILAAPEGTVPFDVRAQALAIKGYWTRALTTYIEGLKPSMRRDQYEGLQAILNGHPALKRPDRLAAANPFEAERHYAIGLREYFDGHYAEAEKQFTTALEFYDLDARYFYFMGLTKLAQSKRDAFEDFEQAARLERRGLPTREAVSAALERIQGPLRKTLNESRDKSK
jgi:hypothetical protein